MAFITVITLDQFHQTYFQLKPDHRGWKLSIHESHAVKQVICDFILQLLLLLTIHQKLSCVKPPRSVLVFFFAVFHKWHFSLTFFFSNSCTMLIIFWWSSFCINSQLLVTANVRTGEWGPLMKTSKKRVCILFFSLAVETAWAMNKIYLTFAPVLLAYALSGVDLNKANHLHTAECFTCCHCSIMLLSEPSAFTSLVVLFCFRSFHLPVCQSWRWQDCVKLMEEIINDAVKVRIDKHLYHRFEIGSNFPFGVHSQAAALCGAVAGMKVLELLRLEGLVTLKQTPAEVLCCSCLSWNCIIALFTKLSFTFAHNWNKHLLLRWTERGTMLFKISCKAGTWEGWLVALPPGYI